MKIKQKGLSVSIDTHTGYVHLRYMYPISFNFYNVFSAAQQAYGYKVVEIKKKDKRSTYFCEFISIGSSQEVFPKFRKCQYNLMLMTRRCKMNVLESDIKNLENVATNYNNVVTEEVILEPINHII